MIRAFKTLFILLLMAALPVQGLATVMKASCGPAHHSSVPVAVAAHQLHHDAGAIHSDDHHDDAIAHSPTDISSSDSSVTADKSPESYKSSYCSVCAACCIGAAAPPSALNPTAGHSGSEIVLISLTPLVAGYIPDGLKRPPRHISA
jgi:hypothetical protein